MVIVSFADDAVMNAKIAGRLRALRGAPPRVNDAPAASGAEGSSTPPAVQTLIEVASQETLVPH
ncbi:UNVERIFIED_CONTAM: hypothetical protein Sradi_5306100 [Sesamum radiatum]|uniref:Uncharacterized protein n=1 Tax=Sesamum radiatum TaxID=300843 RepID=A0AAW2LMY8_SESRA